MVKDSKKYAATGGWGFADFTNGKRARSSFSQLARAKAEAILKEYDGPFPH